MDRSRTWFVSDAIDQYLAAESWQIAKIRQGLEETGPGEFASDGEVEQVFATGSEGCPSTANGQKAALRV